MAEVKDGYPGLAQLMGHDESLGLFKKFSALNSRNLLYMQAELLDLEIKLETYTQADNEMPRTDQRAHYARSASQLRRSLCSTEESDRRQWQLMLEVRRKLEEYSMSSHRISAASSKLTESSKTKRLCSIPKLLAWITQMNTTSMS